MSVIYALDIGGSTLKHALVEPATPIARIVNAFAPVRLQSNRFGELENSVISAVGEVLGTHNHVKTIAISTTGVVSNDGIVVRAGHFADYANVSWDSVLRAKFPTITRVLTANDGKASTWAEFVASEVSHSIFAHIVVGTGIGGGIVVHDQLVYGHSGFAGYLGHIKVTSEETIACSLSAIWLRRDASIRPCYCQSV
ncbi:MAG TPA: ROK family protein [Polyangiaceae bacterium]|nr:ROK family protein [Polyangiaceae bacterium]